MSHFALSGGELVGLLLVLARCTGMVVAGPLFGHRSLPSPAKALLAVGLTVAVAPTASVAPGAAPALLALPIELLIGLTMGFLLSLGFQAIEMAGRLISLQLGLSLDAVLNPLSDGNQGTALDPYFSVLAGVVYLGLNLHVESVRVLSASFTTFPIGGGWPVDLWILARQLVVLTLDLGTRIALPVTLALLLVELFVGLTARAIPQINVFILGLPAKLLIGFGLVALATPALANGAGRAFRTIFDAVAAGGIVSAPR